MRFPASIRSQRAFTLVELLVVVLILAVLAAVAAPSLLGHQTSAQDLDAKSAIASVHKAAKGYWVGDRASADGNAEAGAYPATSAELISYLEPGEPVYSYRASLAGTSHSVGETDVSVRVEGPDVVTLCARSKRQDATLCARYHERGGLLDSSQNTMQASHSTPRRLATALAAVLVPAPAFAQVQPDGNVAYSIGFGERAEEDAIAALPTAASVASCDAGPGNTGRPTWNRKAVCVQTAAPDPDPAPDTTPTPDAPAVDFTATPQPATTSRAAAFSWVTSGGELAAIDCALDGQPVSCAGNSTAFSDLAHNAHSFAVNVSGPGGTDTAVHTWTVTAPPTDRLITGTQGGHATATVLAPVRAAFEVGAWVRLDTMPDLGDRATIASHGCTENNASECRSENAGWALSVTNDGKVHLDVRGAGNGENGWRNETWGRNKERSACFSAEGGVGDTLTAGDWHWVSGAYDPDGRLRVYLNGKLQACSDSGVGNPKILSGDPLMVGAQTDALGAPSAFLHGAVGELRMTVAGAAANVTDPGPAEQPGVLYSPAENGRPALFLYSFSTLQDSMGTLSDLTLHDAAHLGTASD